MGEENKVASRKMLVCIVEHMAKAPTTQIHPAERVSLESLVVLGLDIVSDTDLYDALQRLGKLPCPETISPFVRAVCDLDKFYLRPSPLAGDPTKEGNGT